MAFIINKTLKINVGPFGAKAIDLTILTEVEKLCGARIFDVEYQELRSTDSRIRIFKIKRAFNERDK